MTAVSEQTARAKGFTVKAHWDSGDGFCGDMLIRPDTDIDGDFNAYCLEEGEFMLFHGWAIFIETEEESV